MDEFMFPEVAKKFSKRPTLKELDELKNLGCDIEVAVIRRLRRLQDWVDGTKIDHDRGWKKPIHGV